MFTFTVKMSLQMFYSNIMAHMPSAYGLGKNTIFNKVQFSSVQFKGVFVAFLLATLWALSFLQFSIENFLWQPLIRHSRDIASPS